MPKALVPLHGRPLLTWALEAFTTHPDIDTVVVVAPAAELTAVQTCAGRRAVVVAGGATRQASVDAGLAALTPDVGLVLVHDAARPLVPSSMISAVVAALRAGDQAVIPVLPVADTIKRVDADGQVVATVDRRELRAVQTPQGFLRSVLLAAHRAAEDRSLTDVTDDAGLAEALGVPVRTVAGSELCFKVTTPHDLRLAHAMAAELDAPTQAGGPPMAQPAGPSVTQAGGPPTSQAGGLP
ncbi:MAG: 2-C-methyl-D-erythritol 4-phosphate cytidylyltransferase [Pseudonocardiales bacterium]|jgi:2-C-methyl-D-erythritol 4-phosphate cytidylyltransferase|nr:2-C-methyl-D-erythritol 4-phosphate cytidylyltransferase [Pseudonocardiales bacterium]